MQITTPGIGSFTPTSLHGVPSRDADMILLDHASAISRLHLGFISRLYISAGDMILLGLIAAGSVALVGLGLKNYRRGEAAA